MSYDLEQHLQAERSKNRKPWIVSQFRKDRKEFIKYGKRRVQSFLDDFKDGEYVGEIRNGKITKLRSYIE